MSSRDMILKRVRAALTDVPDTERPEDVLVSRDFQLSRPGNDVTDLLVDRLVDYKAVVHRDVSVAELLARRGGRIVVPSGVPDDWIEDVKTVVDDPILSPAELDELSGVVTGCAVAIAETGTIVLDGSADQGRRALTLVPDYHLCVVRTDQIVWTVPEALACLDPSRPLTWISGPSATSDIENSRVEGVHGPRILEVVICP